MKKVTTMMIIIISMLAVFAQQATAQTKDERKKMKADRKAYAKLKTEETKALTALNKKYDKWQSSLLDTLLSNVKRIEKQTTGSDTTSVMESIKKEVRIFQDSIMNLDSTFQKDWAEHTENFSGVTTDIVSVLNVSGRYVTVPRVNEILNTKVLRGKTAKTYNEVFRETMQLGKKSMYYMRGDNMKYHYEDTIWQEMRYYAPYDKDSIGTQVKAFMHNREGFEEAIPISYEGTRAIYAAKIANKYWYRWSSLQVARWLYEAIVENIAWRHARQ